MGSRGQYLTSHPSTATNTQKVVTLSPEEWEQVKKAMTDGETSIMLDRGLVLIRSDLHFDSAVAI